MPEIFLSHSCDDHEPVRALAGRLEACGHVVVVDPFSPGDRTAEKIEACIKRSTHFVQFYTSRCAHSRWVEIESIFGRLCHEQSAAVFIPLQEDGGPVWEPTQDLMRIRWGGAELEDLARAVDHAVRAGQPRRRLTLDERSSEEVKELGREFERLARRHDDPTSLHHAVQSYEVALRLCFSNCNAWANLAWSLWKLGEAGRAWSNVRIAKLLCPHSNHVSDVASRMAQGRRRIS